MKYKDMVKYSDPTYFWFTLVAGILLLGMSVISFIYFTDGLKFAWVFFFCMSIIGFSWCIHEYSAMVEKCRINSKIDTKLGKLKENIDTSEDDLIKYKLPENFSIFDYNEVLWKQNN